jgi:hypothetical protein
MKFLVNMSRVDVAGHDGEELDIPTGESTHDAGGVSYLPFRECRFSMRVILLCAL